MRLAVERAGCAGDGRLAEEAAFGCDSYVRAIRSADGPRLERTPVEVIERPPMAELLAERR